MQFMEYFSLLQKHGLSHAILDFLALLKQRGLPYAISVISLLSHKNVVSRMQFLKFLYFLTKNVDYHMQFLEFISLLKKHRLPYAIYEIFFSFQKRGLSYAISRVSFSSPKTWTIISNF